MTATSATTPPDGPAARLTFQVAMAARRHKSSGNLVPNSRNYRDCSIPSKQFPSPPGAAAVPTLHTNPVHAGRRRPSERCMYSDTVKRFTMTFPVRAAAETEFCAQRFARQHLVAIVILVTRAAVLEVGPYSSIHRCADGTPTAFLQSCRDLLPPA